MAAPGGPFAGLTTLFSDLPPESFAGAAADLGVPAAALGAGYAVFFFYSCLIGLAALALALIIAGRQMRGATPGKRAAPAPPEVDMVAGRRPYLQGSPRADAVLVIARANL
jgi:PAT family beta-lactamase induction signal transducer AmpG